VKASFLGRIGHAEAVALMEATRERVLAGGPEALYLCEHDPVITIGRSGDPGNVLAAGEVEVARVSRGGDVTYHGPGQLMVYPVVRLRGPLVALLERLAAALARTAAELGVPGARWRREPAGLWLPEGPHGFAKLAACGVHLRRRVLVHGFALDVCTPSQAWARIVPCGLGTPVVSLAAARAARGLPPLPVAAVAAVAAPHLERALARPGAIADVVPAG
jgi:lipoyl(octanoyl) transferase